MIRKFGVFLAALALIAGFGLTGCDSWMSGDHFFDTIADEVKYANAEVIPVYVRYPTSTWGSTSPNGRSSQKVDIPFTVTAVDNNEYGFYKWAAFSTTNYRTSYGRYNVQLVDSEEAFDTEYADEMLGEDEVVFEDPYSPSTTVRVLSERDDVFIMPVCVKRPVLQDSLPAQNQTGATKNTTIQLIFSNAMNPNFLLVKSDGTAIPDGYTGDKFLNTNYVHVEQIMASGEHPFYADITTRLRKSDNSSYTTTNGTDSAGNAIIRLPAELNTSGKTLTIKLPSSTAYWPNGTILVTIDQDVQDKLGYTMPDDNELVFGAGNDEDTIKPVIMGLEVGTTSLSNNAGDNYPRVGKNFNVRAYIADQTKSGETASEGNVNLVKFDLRRYTYEVYRTLPSPVSGISPSNGYYSPVYLNPDSNNYSPAVNFTDMPGVYPKAVASSSLGTVFQIQPQIAPGPGYDSGCGGLYKLTAYGVDNVGNQGDPDDLKLSKDGNDAGYKYIMFIRDIDAPVAATCAGKISSANLTYAPYGWYGSNGLGHIQLKEVSAGAIKDAGVPDVHQDTDPDLRYYSDTVWWAFFAGSSTAADTWATDMQQPENAWDSSKWTEVSSTSTPLSTLLGHDLDTSTITEGDVTIYAVFKDDVGNVSSKAAVNAIKYDGTAPQVGTLSWITASDVPVGFTGYAKIGNHTLAIPFTESLSGIKKISVEVVPPGGGAAYKQAFSAADFSIRRKYSATSNTYIDCGFTRSPATPAAGAAQNLVLGGATDVLDYSLKSDTSYTYLNAIYLDNLKIAASDSDLVEGNYTIKVKLYDAALNESAEKTITICVDNAAPVIQKLLVKDAKQYAEKASEPDDDDTYKYFLPSSAYDSSISGYKATLEVTVQEAAGLLELSLGSDAYLTSTSTVSLKNAATNAAITAPYTVNTTDNKILFTEKGTAMCATGNFIVTITNVKIPGTSSGVGSRTISVTAKDYALRSPENAFSTLSFEGDSATYSAVLVDNPNSSPSDVTTFTVKGSPYNTDPDGYANNPTLAKTTLVFPSFGESGLKKIKFTGLKANKSTVGGTRVYRGTSTAGAGLGYTLEDDGPNSGTTIVLDYPIVSSSAVTLTITNLELTSLTQGSNTLSAKYEYLAGWASAVKTTTVIYDTVAPVVGSSTESMKWIVNSSSTGTAGITGTATVNNQYLVIPVTETNSGVRKIRIEVEKENAEGTMAATTTASCENVSYVGYSSSTGTSTSGASTLNTSYWSVADNEITIVDPATYGKAGWYYIKGITISSAADAALEEGNYTLKVTLYDYAGNASATKTIDISNDHTKPVVKDVWFDGVENTALNGSGTYKHPHHRTYTNSSTGNILYVKLAENGSGIKNINLDHYTGYDPYSGAGGCRTVIPTASTKLYKSTDNGTTYTEVTGISYSATSSDRSITIPQTQAISGSGDILLKITELKITEGNATTDDEYRNKIAAALRVDLTDFATNVNEAPENPASATVGTNNPFAAVVEDSSSPGFKTDCRVMRDSGKRISATTGTLVDDENSIAAYDGYTNTSVVNIECAISEFAWNSDVTSPSGLRVIKLEGASFIPDTEQDGSSGSYIKWREYGTAEWHANFNSIPISGQRSQYYLSSKDSIENCGFGYAEADLGFYLVGNDTLVFKTPMNVKDDYWFYINNIKLNSTTSDGSKSVTVKLFDTANQYSTSCASVGTATFSIVYCGTAPTITVNDTAKSDPATITAANIQTLVPKNNGLQAYAEGTTVWTFSHSSQGNRKGSNSTPSGNGVYLGRSYCPYFDLDITPSTAANLLYYKWTNSETVPTSWNTTNSSYKVDVNFPTSGDVSADSVTAMDWYLHVADYAGNVTTKKMSQCQWINETVASAWPKRKDDTGKKMENGVYYLESDGFYATDIPRLTVTLPAGTTGAVKVYIPTSWFDKVCTNGAPIYGYAMGNHERYGEGHEDISKAKRDATGPYLEIPQSYITESTAQSTNYAEFYFYVYDAVGQDLTAVVKVTVDSTPPYFEVNLVPQGGTSSSNKHMKWSQKTGILTMSSSPTTLDPDNRICVKHSYNDSSAPIATFLVQGGTGDSNYLTTGMTSIGLSSSNPFVLYTDADSLALTFLTRTTADSAYPNEGDTLKIKYSINDATATEIDNSFTAWSYDPTYFYGENASISVTNTPQTIKFSAVDKGANSSDIYIKLVKDTEGPTISATDVQKVNQITETSGGTSEVVNYFGSQATAKISISDEYAGLSSANGGFSTDSVNLVNDLPDPTSDKSLVISVSDRFGNASNSSMTYNGSNKWVMDVTSPGTPTLSYDASYPYPTTNSISSDYNKYNSNGLTVTSSGSSYTIKYAGGVNTITISPNPNSSDSDVMGYLFRDSTTGLATFYSVADVSQSITIPVTPTSSTITKYIYAVDKAGNPSSDTSYLTVSLQKNDTSPTLKSISGTGLYSSGANGWFKSGANLTPVVATVANPNTTITPSQGIIGYGHEDGQWTIMNPYSSPITVPADYDGKPSIWLCFYSGEWCEDYFIKAEGGTVSATTSNTVTTWTKDATPPSKPTVSCSAENVYCNSSTKTIYYKSGVNSITITPSSTDTGGSGVKGYALSPTGTPATSITVPESGSAIPSSITVYAFDNVGNSNSETFTLTMDSAKPTIERAAGENSLDGCIPVGGNLFFKDGNAKLKIKVTDTGSGLKSGSSYLTLDENSEVWIKLSDYVSTSGVVTIPNPSNSSTKGVSDNVGNAYTSDSPYQLTGLVVKEDSTPPTRPTSVSDAAPTGGVCLDTSSGIVVYYNDTTTAVTLTLVGADDGTNGSGVTGYTVDGISDVESTAITVTIPVSGFAATQSVSIKSKDGVGNESEEALSVTLIKDEGKPSVSITSITGGKTYSGTSAFYYNNSGSYAMAKLSISDSGSGLASGSWQDNKEIQVSTYYNSTSNIIEIGTDPIVIVDNVGNTQSYQLKYNDKNIIFDATGPDAPTVSAISATGGAYHQDGNTVYFSVSGSATQLVITPDSADNPGGCGVAGYSTSSSGTTSSTIAINVSSITSSTTQTIYAIDNLGNASTALTLTLVKDETKPSVSISSVSGGKTYTSGSTMYFKDASDTDKVQAVLSITDSGSGLKSTSWQNGKTLNLSDSGVLNGNGEIVIESGNVIDNVENTQAYVINGYTYKFVKDVTAPDAPTGFKVTAPTSGVCVKGTATDGYYPATGTTVYYSGTPESLTLALTGSSDAGCGLAGYALNDTDTPDTTVSVDLTSSPTSVAVYAYDKLGNKSTAFTITLIKDVAAPTFTQNGNTINPATTKALSLSSGGSTGWKVNVFEAGTTISIPITETGSGLKRYALIQSSSYEANPATASWANATGSPIEFELPEVTSPKTNLILLLEDNVGNVTVDDATNHYKNATIEKDGGWWMQLGSLSDITATYSVIESGAKMEITLSNVAVPIKSIEATAAGATGGDGKAKFDYKKDDGTIDYAEVLTATGITNGAKYTDSTGYLPHAGTVKFVLAGSGLTAPTSIKINGTELAAASISPATSLSGFIRHNLPAIESLVDNSGRSGVIRRSYGTERAVDLATYFNALSSAPEEKAEDTKIAFNIGRNMENGGIAEKTEKVVTTAEEGGYMDEASIAEELPVQNHAWRAPDGFVSEETEAAGNQLLAQNAVVEFSSPNKVLTATDAALEDESGKNYEKWLALALSLLSVCALGLVVTLGRGRMKKNS